MLYLIRHAHAVDAEENPERPLSAKGRAQVAQLVTIFGRDGRLTPTEIWHSPLVRSQETAALLASGLALTAPLVLTPGLEPEDDPRALLPRLNALDRSVAIVGHQPFLGWLAGLLTGSPGTLVFRKGTTVCLELNGARWIPQWQVSPENSEI